jgi:hypothetical protein
MFIQSYIVYFHYQNITFYFSERYPFEPPFSQINFYNCTIQHNKQGILTKHYNNPSNEKLEIFHRIKEEEIRFEMVNVFDNMEEAMYIPSLTKYHDQLIPTPEEMTRDKYCQRTLNS